MFPGKKKGAHKDQTLITITFNSFMDSYKINEIF